LSSPLRGELDELRPERKRGEKLGDGLNSLGQLRPQAATGEKRIGTDSALEEPVRRPKPEHPPRQGVGHGVSVLALVMIFLALHIANHLMFPAGAETYDAVMKVFRHDYRHEIVQPLLVALFLFQTGTRLFFVWQHTVMPSSSAYFQIASGVYPPLRASLINSAFIFARTYLGIDTGWDFATGAPTGLVKDPRNIRLVPHY